MIFFGVGFGSYCSFVYVNEDLDNLLLFHDRVVQLAGVAHRV